MFMCVDMCAPAWVHTHHVCAGTHGGQRVSALELQVDSSELPGVGNSCEPRGMGDSYRFVYFNR